MFTASKCHHHGNLNLHLGNMKHHVQNGEREGLKTSTRTKGTMCNLIHRCNISLDAGTRKTEVRYDEDVTEPADVDGTELSAALFSDSRLANNHTSKTSRPAGVCCPAALGPDQVNTGSHATSSSSSSCQLAKQVNVTVSAGGDGYVSAHLFSD